ncbi:ABC transporter substrate-binding protein [Pollutimonas bauzanensis]|uniref:ABC-type nitrate/sulfonate/bicarbonate transport system, substrate-binding protein n=1 Tax=Pollutimonas bauzanensis TaxID=658167 RepID=A0A1M5ZJC8_9BURK|nr:ABC transporter substrate-binding protein [Pollutimonas bauzanensis]SHI24239.1 ABC-type nitrate/sulfonate/bicarbonate transport system, substrate-binding protein [Pollutimonas bauzanensis]
MPTRSLLYKAAFILSIALPAIGHAQASSSIKLGYAKCAHCTPMALTPEYASGVNVEAIGFNTGNDVLTALVSKSIDVAQVTYLHYATALDRGFDLVAISGQINGGSQTLIGNALPVKENDWEGLKKVIADYKKEGKPFRVAASRGNAQDLHMRGSLAAHGIMVDKDVQFVNIPNPSDHVQALRRGEVELVTSVEPFATQIRQANAAKFFAFPYDQAAGRLTNLVVTRSDVIAEKPQAVQETVRAIVKVDERISADKPLWIATIQKYTGLDKAIASDAVENLSPDYKIHRASAVAIARMMFDLKYITKDVSAAVEKNMDYRYLEAATGKPKTELGY